MRADDRRAVRSPGLALAIGLTLAACGGAMKVAPPPAASAHGAQVWLSTPDRAHLLERQADAPIATADPEGGMRIDVDTAQRYQTMVGFGAALTDASAELIARRLTPAQRATLLTELFGRGATGVGFGMLRITIGASDFSRTHFALDDIAAGTRDDALAQFSIAAEQRDVIPMLQQIRAVNPDLAIIATPWSAPAWMKSSGSLVMGTLRPDAYPAFARYLTAFIDAYAARKIPIAYLTVQNEPHNEPTDYPGMRFDAAQRATFIGQHLGPLFAQRRIATRILDWDHNWDEPQSPLGVLGDLTARRYVSGVAWHCYAGDVAAQSRVHDAYPDKDAFFTECAGGAWAPHFGDNLRWNVGTLIIGATRHWARGVTLWNLALDEHHGPHLGGCNDCRGVLTIDSASGAVTRNEEFYALGHASRFVQRGAIRIASTTGVHDLDTVAFRNTDGSLVLLVVNGATAAQTFTVRTGGNAFRVTQPAGAVATYVWR